MSNNTTTMEEAIIRDNLNLSHHPTHFVSTEGGIFSGKGLLNSPLALFLVQATLIIGLSRLIHRGAMYHFRQPRVIAEIIGGICLGPSLLGRIPHFTETFFPTQSLPILSLISSFGLVLYMFLMGLELDTGLLLKGIRRFTVISLAGIMLPGAFGAAVSYGLYQYLLEEQKRATTPFSSFLLFTFVALAITAFPVLARILTEKKLLVTTVGLMTISAAAIDDIFAWVLLALTVSIITAGNSFIALYVLVSISLYAALLLVPGRILLRKIFQKFLGLGGGDHGEAKAVLTQILLALIFIMVFLSAWTTEWIGVHAIFGAFLAGIIIPRIGGITVELTHMIEDIVTIVFLPLYFASSGLKTRLSLLNDWTTAFFCVAVILVACTGKIVGCTLAAKWTGFPWREALSIGVLMNTKGLVELIVLNIGLDAGVINDRIFAVMVVMALVTTFMTSPLIAYIYPPKYQESARPRSASLSKRRQQKKASHVASAAEPASSDGEIERIFVCLQSINSIPLGANILQIFRVSLAPGLKMCLNGFKAFTDMERSSHIMVSTQTDRIIENDPVLRMFRFFGKLIGSPTRCFVATTRLSDIGIEVDRLVEDQHCDVVLVPWQTEDDVQGCDQRIATLSILDRIRQNTVVVAVDRRPDGTDSLLQSTPPFDAIIVPLLAATASPNERAALHLACRLRRNANRTMPMAIVFLHQRHEDDGGTIKVAAQETSDEIGAIKRAIKNYGAEIGACEGVVFHAVNCDVGTNKLQSMKDAILAITPKLASSPSDGPPHALVILGQHSILIETVPSRVATPTMPVSDHQTTLPAGRPPKRTITIDGSLPEEEEAENANKLEGEGAGAVELRPHRSVSFSSALRRFGSERRETLKRQRTMSTATMAAVAEEERIFGSLGKLLYSMGGANSATGADNFPSLLVVHELDEDENDDTKEEEADEKNGGKMKNGGVGA